MSFLIMTLQNNDLRWKYNKNINYNLKYIHFKFKFIIYDSITEHRTHAIIKQATGSTN